MIQLHLLKRSEIVICSLLLSFQSVLTPSSITVLQCSISTLYWHCVAKNTYNYMHHSVFLELCHNCTKLPTDTSSIQQWAKNIQCLSTICIPWCTVLLKIDGTVNFDWWAGAFAKKTCWKGRKAMETQCCKNRSKLYIFVLTCIMV